MASLPEPTRYHRMLGWHAPAIRRAATVVILWVVIATALAVTPLDWELAVIAGWDAASLVFLGSVWPIFVKADGTKTEALASREDQTHGSATALLAAACMVSLLGVAFALGRAADEHGAFRGVLIGIAVLTVASAWVTMNTVYTLRYAKLDYQSKGTRIDFGEPLSQHKPTYRDFAYLAFTIGMTYQVSDTTLRSSPIRRTALGHALLSYVFGVAIVAGAINLLAGLVNN
ncbi:DUF1345 domain-containing protein [Asanoa siamensis]|uniref:DUF1345 domain-containing protein n=1 Tax=Asanoa siamensis TaxID=926357 RepID=A0ABQ4CL66_9ACTN|nr:DUF1345 domain-containing protein [Asanoa siamensis]GIF72034.1 hypothetical protein Asi02nite_15520 [Asanoa siamensis]